MQYRGVFVSDNPNSRLTLCDKQFLLLDRYAQISELEAAQKWIKLTPKSIGVIELSTKSTTSLRQLMAFLGTDSPTLAILPNLSANHAPLLSSAPNCGFVCATDSSAAIRRCLTTTINHGFAISSSLLIRLINSPERALFQAVLARFTQDEIEILYLLSTNTKTHNIAMLTNYSCSSINRKIRKFNEIFNTSSKSELTFYLRNLTVEYGFPKRKAYDAQKSNGNLTI